MQSSVHTSRILHLRSIGDVLGGVCSADQVVHNIGVPNSLLNRFRVSQIVLDKRHSAQVAGHFEMPLGHLLSVWHNYIAPHPSYVRVFRQP